MFTLKQLRAALALAETGHFGRAAALCHVSQPALSQQIRLLEEACGVVMFDRLGKAVRPTPFGQEFIERAKVLVQQADELEGFASARGGAPSRPIRFGVIPTVAPYLLPELFPILRGGFPELAFAVSESRTAPLLAGLHDGSLDLALIATAPPADGPKLTCAPLFEDGFVLAVGEDEPGAGPVPLSSIDRARMLLLDEGHCFRDQALAACGFKPEPAQTSFAATSLSTIVEFVANGQGVTLLPEIALRKETADRRIRIRTLQSPGAARTLSLVWREASPFAPTFAAIAAAIRDGRGAPDQAAAAR